MNLKVKTLLTIFAVLGGSLISSAQVGSPYSQFGFGDNENRGFEQSKAMGGIGIGLRSEKNLNVLNPASYTEFDSLTIIYSVGLNSGVNSIESSIDKTIKGDANLGYFALGFRGNRYWASSFGLAVVSKVDYLFKYQENNDVNGTIDYYLYGEGGLNKVYWSNAFLITPDLSVGINASYIFGAINKVSTVIFTDSVKAGLYDNTKVKRKQNVYDFTFNYGVQYRIKLSNNRNLIVGAVYENKMKMKAKHSVLGGTSKTPSNSDGSYYKDIYTNDLQKVIIDTADIRETITLPQAFGLGFTYNSKNRLIVGADFYRQYWSTVNYDLYSATFKDLVSFRAGLQYTPDQNNVNYYFKRIQYRLGGHYSKSHLEIKNTRINDYGMSFGVGFPLRNTKTSFNISFELGQRGTLEQNLLRETYGIVSLNLSLSDIWFVKRKFK